MFAEIWAQILNSLGNSHPLYRVNRETAELAEFSQFPTVEVVPDAVCSFPFAVSSTFVEPCSDLNNIDGLADAWAIGVMIGQDGFGSTTTLVLEDVKELEDSDFSLSFDLESISFLCCNMDKLTADAFEQMESIEKLHIDNITRLDNLGFRFTPDIAKNLGSLKSLHISPFLLGTNLNKIFKKLKKLETLNISAQNGEFEESYTLDLDGECFKYLPHLRSLNIAGHRVKSWKFLTGLKSLTSSMVPSNFADCPNLEILNLLFEDPHTQHIEIMCHLPNLVRLTTCNYFGAKPDEFAAIDWIKLD
jgi:hypothetical protein